MVLSYEIDEAHIEEGDGIVLTAEGVDSWVSFYNMDGQTVVELRLEKTNDGSSPFFLHFELEDVDRAEQLFLEMVSTLDSFLYREVQHVLLCCTCDMTTTFC